MGEDRGGLIFSDPTVTYNYIFSSDMWGQLLFRDTMVM